MNKSLDATFMHYGIRREDLAIIEQICEEYEIDFDMFKEDILKKYHELKIKNEDIEINALQKIIEKALNQ